VTIKRDKSTFTVRTVEGDKVTYVNAVGDVVITVGRCRSTTG